MHRIEKRYEGRVVVRVVDIASPEGQSIAGRAALNRTPSFVLTDSTGTAIAKFSGPTSYLALSTLIEGALRE